MSSITEELAEKLVEAYKDNPEEVYAILQHTQVIGLLDGQSYTKKSWTVENFWLIHKEEKYLFHFRKRLKI